MLSLPLKGLGLGGLLLATSLAFAEGPAVVASIKPVHSLLTQVMRGVGEPHLLLRGSESPHHYALRPSDAQALQRADLVVWIGPQLETFLTRPIETLSQNTMTLRLANAPGIGLFEVRTGGLWSTYLEQHDGESDHGHHHHGHGEHAGHDVHVWLDPISAMALVEAMAEALHQIDPLRSKTYRANAREAIARLQALHEEMAQMLAPVQGRGFIVLHDAWQYLERRYGLLAVGAITIGAAEQMPGPARLVELRDILKQRQAVCVLSEPQFNVRAAQVLAEDSQSRYGVLDPVGVDLPPGEGMYETLMRRNAAALRDCLTP